MQSQQLKNTMQSEVAVCPVGNPVGNLCPWCGELLPASKTKPRKFCSEAHEKAFKRAGCISKESNQAEVLAAANQRMRQMVWIPGTGTFFDQGAQPTEKRVPDSAACENVAVSNAFHPLGVDSYRIPKYARGLQKAAAEGSLATTPRKITHQIDVNDRDGVSGDNRYKAPTASNMETPADRLLWVIFAEKRGCE